MTQLEKLLLEQLEELTKQFTLQSDESIKQFQDLQSQLNEINQRLTQEQTAPQATRNNETFTAKLPISLPCRDCIHSKATSVPTEPRWTRPTKPSWISPKTEPEPAVWKTIDLRVRCLLTHQTTYNDSEKSKLLSITDCSKHQK